jgi:hypothetical protein
VLQVIQSAPVEAMWDLGALVKLVVPVAEEADTTLTMADYAVHHFTRSCELGLVDFAWPQLVTTFRTDSIDTTLCDHMIAGIGPGGVAERLARTHNHAKQLLARFVHDMMLAGRSSYPSDTCRSGRAAIKGKVVQTEDTVA